jgi:hypothetical protein
MAGYFQETITVTGTNGSTKRIKMNGSASVHYRAVYLSQVTASVTNGTTERIFVYQTSGNGSTNATVAGASVNVIYQNATFTASYLNARNLWRFGTSTGGSDTDNMKLFVTVLANGTNAVNGTTITGTVVLGGFGLN